MAWDNTSWGVTSSPKDSIPKIQTNLDYLYNSIGGSSDITAAILALSKSYADTKIATTIGAAPAMLDTLQELANALGNDPNFATTVTNLIGTKAPLASPTFTGTVTLPQTIMTGAINETMATRASAGNIAIGAAGGNLIAITGTTTITSFDNVQAGVKRTLRFAESLTVTHNGSSLILPGGTDITVNSGDAMEFTSFGNGNWRCTNYQSTNDTNRVSRLQEGSVYHYKDLVSYSYTTGSLPGTMKITLPTSWTSTMLQIKISGYNHISGTDGAINWNAELGGYNYIGSNSWDKATAILSPNCPFTSVRFAHDGTKCCILLGTTSSPWSHPKITVTDVIAGYTGQGLFSSGWTISPITDETGITVSNTPTPVGYVTTDKSNTIAGSLTLAPSGITSAILGKDANGSIELGDILGTATVGSYKPYIDWHYAMGSAQDLNVRTQNHRDGGFAFIGNSSNAMEVCCYGIMNGTRHGFMLGQTGAYGYLDYDTSGGSVRLSALNNMLFGFNNAAAHNSNTFTERMRLTSAGNVGIGITSPGSLLHVNAVGSGTNGIIISQPTAGFSPFLTWRTGDTVNPQYSIRYIGGASGGLSFGLGDSSSFNSMVRFSSDGNIGIGNTAPTVPLDVSGQIKSTEAGSTPGLLITGKSSSVSGADMVIERSSSTSSAASAPNVLLRDLSTNYGSLIQSYGGQTQFYQLNALNPSSWIQAMYIDNIANILNTRMIRPIADNAYTCGDGTRRWSTVYAATSTIATSDERAKTDIIDSTLGLDFVNKLRPVSYKFKIGGNTVTQEEDGIEEVVISEAVENEDGSITPAVTEERTKYKEVVTPKAGVRTHYGMIAQEVKTTLGDTDFGGYIYDAETDTYGLRYEEFIAPLIKAVQELTVRVKELESKISA